MDAIQQQRCRWCTRDPLYIDYHDHEWGRPVSTDQALFERLVLEGMQAGLSWLTVLKKRQAMRQHFGDFDIHWLAGEGHKHLQDWLADASLIRHAGKLNAMINNANIVVDLTSRGHPFARWLWSFAPSAHVPLVPDGAQAPVPGALNMAKALKGAGFRFVGPTTCYAFMQSVGMVNDHQPDCLAYADCLAAWHHPLRPR